MKSILLLSLITFVSSAYAQITSNGTGGGTWNDPNTWDCGGCIPTQTDDVIILDGDVVETTSFSQCHELDINDGGTLTCNAVTECWRHYTNNGTHNGSSEFRLRNWNQIDGNGIVSLGSSNFLMRDGNKTFRSTCNLTFNNRVLLSTGITAFNNGNLTIYTLTSASSESWINEANSSIFITNAIGGNIVLDCSSTGNKVTYGKTGTANANIRVPSGSGGQYYDLEIGGDNYGSIKTFDGSFTVLNDFTLSGSSVSAGASSPTITIGGNWSNTGAIFYPYGSTVEMNGSSTQTISNNTGEEDFNNLIISGTQSDVSCNLDLNGDLTINSILNPTNSSHQINLRGDWSNTGSYNQQTGTVIFDGVTSQNISGSTTWNNLTISGTSVTTSGSQSLIDELNLTSGSFNTGGDFTLISDASGTARISRLGSTVSISGDITMQRYIDAGSTNWRFLTSSVSGSTIADFNDDFVTSGYPGANYPNWPTAADPWPSVYIYDESNSGDYDAGYEAAPSSSETISRGRGVWVYSGDTSTGTQPFTIDYTGGIQKNAINLPVTFTNTGNTDDGWNLVGNPYPSQVDWDAVEWGKNGVVTAFWVFDPDNNNYKGYSTVFGSFLNGGTNLIASGQAFLVKAHGGSSPFLQINEGCKTDATTAFIRSNNVLSGINFKIENLNGISDECKLMSIEQATSSVDQAYDISKLFSPSQDAVSIYTKINEGSFTINSINSTFSGKIPMEVKVPYSGVHTLYISGTEKFSDRCVILEETSTGNKYSLNTDQSFTVNLLAGQTNHFIIHVKESIVGNTIDVTCNGSTDGSITLLNDNSNSWSYYVSDFFGNSVKTGNSVNSSETINNLLPGQYEISYTNDNKVCNNYNTIVEILQPEEIQATANIYDVENGNDGVIETNVSGGTAPYSYYWATGETTPEVSGLNPGSYLLEVTDANGCTKDFTFDVNGNVLSIEEVNSEFNILTKENQIEINSENNNIDKVEVYNSAGALVKTSNNGIVSTENFATGIYNFVVYSGGKMNTIKIKR